MMRALTRKFRLPAALARLIGESRGVSAVEFALVAPLMISVYLGCAAISDGVAVDRKVSLIAGTLANLTASCGDSNTNSGSCPNNIISSTEMTNIFAASSAIMQPYSTGPLKMSLSCIAIDDKGNVTVPWSVPSNGGTKLTSFTFSDTESALKVKSTQLLYAVVSYNYTPIVGTGFIPNLTLADHMFMSPRLSAPSYYDGATTYTCG
jgi:Flp pilus assembly protein TadG